MEALADGGPGSKVIAGGTNLYDLMKLRIENPQSVVDISRIPELTQIRTTGACDLQRCAGLGQATAVDVASRRIP